MPDNKPFNNKLSDNNLASELVENRSFLNQEGADDTGGIELEWLGNPEVLTTEGHVTPQVQGASATLGPDAQPAEVPYQPS